MQNFHTPFNFLECFKTTIYRQWESQENAKQQHTKVIIASVRYLANITYLFLLFESSISFLRTRFILSECLGKLMLKHCNVISALADVLNTNLDSL